MNIGKRLSLDISNRLDYIRMVSLWQVLSLFIFQFLRLLLSLFRTVLKRQTKFRYSKKINLFLQYSLQLMITSNDLTTSTTMGSEVHLTYHLGLVQIVHFFLWLLIVNIQYNN